MEEINDGQWLHGMRKSSDGQNGYFTFFITFLGVERNKIMYEKNMLRYADLTCNSLCSRTIM
jgi:hypothetical protein